MTQSLCPNCADNIPTFEIKNKVLLLNCPCGYHNTFSLHFYLKYSRSFKQIHNYNFRCKLHNNLYEYYCERCHFHLCNECFYEHQEDEHYLIKFNDDYFKTIINKVKQHLDEYCVSLKNGLIKEMINEINAIDDQYIETMNLEEDILEFLQLCAQNISTINTDKEVSLSDLLLRAKNKKIKRLIYKINLIESAYENNYKRSNDILEMLILLIEKYNHQEKVYHNILDIINLNLTYCDGKYNETSVINYYNSFLLMNQTITPNNFFVNSSRALYNFSIRNCIINNEELTKKCILFNNGILALCFNTYIRFFDPQCKAKSLEECYKQISFGTPINCVYQLSNGFLVTCVDRKHLIFWKLYNKEFHTLYINLTYQFVEKVVELPDNKIATLSRENIKIWRSNYPFNGTNLYSYYDNSGFILKDILFFKPLDGFITYFSTDSKSEKINYISVKNIKTEVEKKYKIDIDNNILINKIYLYDAERIIITNKNGLLFFNVIKGIIDIRINSNEVWLTRNLIKLRNNNLLGAFRNGDIIIIDINTKIINKILLKSEGNTIGLLRIDDKSFITITNQSEVVEWYY